MGDRIKRFRQFLSAQPTQDRSPDDRRRTSANHRKLNGPTLHDVPEAYLSDPTFAALLTEAEKYITSVAKDRKAPSGGKSRTREADDAAIFA